VHFYPIIHYWIAKLKIVLQQGADNVKEIGNKCENVKNVQQYDNCLENCNLGQHNFQFLIITYRKQLSCFKHCVFTDCLFFSMAAKPSTSFIFVANVQYMHVLNFLLFEMCFFLVLWVQLDYLYGIFTVLTLIIPKKGNLRWTTKF
jgi:hypothetical protein